ncbi:putative helix-turn-helix protein, YlxM/p13 family protein [Thermosinus carboxydivorans Nor1]|uniref:UPF0122 protein TcarDRAFT_2175 n=1 Tax=Thermosinus carboxydivorans Nor1 TaxID=401526 RepID=A1HN77_9FIRM|nr:YlxM family DNA-binding protein [Thermosinus carboxydivorans]EAX48703.1 putative helix-turn-helix protein, YlxM/p13 family protein [Thermosinus carboxydivorans Nor1]
MLDKVLRIGVLYDYYGALLTNRQKECLEMHYFQDYSLSEIAEEFNVSRQAVHDILRRAELILEEFEAKLRLVERRQSEQKRIRQACELLSGLPAEVLQQPQVSKALEILERLLET